MKTTPTRRRRRDNGVLESWTENDETSGVDVELPAVPLLAAPPHAAGPRSATDTGSRALDGVTGGSRGEALRTPELDRPTQFSLPAGDETHSVETILAATELLQRLDRLQTELSRGTDDVHLAHDYRTVCAEIITRFPWLALSKDIDQRLWSSWQRELAALESGLAGASSGAIENKTQVEMRLRDALYVALRNYSALIQQIQSASSGAVDATTALLVHRLSLSHAHVLYALEIHSASQHKKNWRTPELYYEKARRWCVAQGETHYHLARIVLHDGRCADALYHLMRSRVAHVVFESPGSLADQYTHIASLRSSAASDTALAVSGDSLWLELDGAVLSAVAPYFGNEQDFLTQRRAPRQLAMALGKLLDAICNDDDTSSAANREQDGEATIGATSSATGSLQIVRIVSLLISCACLPSAFVAATTTPPSTTAHATDINDFVSVKNPRAIELIVSFVNVLLHRALGAITSPLRTMTQKEHALQLMLPPISIAFAWLLKLPWRGMVAETTRTSCEQLSTMMLTGIIAGGFLAPLEELSGRQCDATAALVEEIEVAGLVCYGESGDAAAISANTDAGLEGSDEEDALLLQRRIGKFLSHVEAFMTPRPVAAVAVMAAVEPHVATALQDPRQQQAPATDDVTTQLATRLELGTSDADTRGRASSSRQLWTPAASKSSVSSVSNKPSKAATSESAAAATIVPKALALASTLKSTERVVVLDAANIAMRHGLQRRFSCRGIQLCVEFFVAQGDRVVAFLPDYCLDVDPDGAFRRRATASSGGRARRREGRCRISPDDRVLVEIMVDSGVVVLTPAMDSDDLYCIHYARRHNAFLVTNDLFRDHISETDGPKARQTELRNWLQARRISYTWVADEFLPNPNSAYEKMRSSNGRSCTPSTTSC